MLQHTDIPEARWYQVDTDDKRRARLICISHLLEHIPHEDVIPGPIKLPPRPSQQELYTRPPRTVIWCCPTPTPTAERSAIQQALM